MASFPVGGRLRRYALVFAIALILFLTLHAAAQTPATTPPSPDQSAPSLTLHVSTRMVTVDVVARDHKGRPATGLTAADFQVFDQVSGFHKEKRAQKIAAFRALGIMDFASKDGDNLSVPAGVYTNLVTMQKNPVPPTMILVDGLNTDVTAQMQVHQQMVRMLNSLPDDVPVAIFLLGRRLRMLQGFTTDPKLLKAALQKASTVEASGLRQLDPRDDPDSLSSFQEQLTGVAPDALQHFEQETYVFAMDIRVRETIEALRSIARHVAGYPGRKNLLWISSSFPIAINPEIDSFNTFRDYGSQMEDLANTLGEVKIAVYPIDPGGLQTFSTMQASRRTRGGFGGSSADAISRESQMRINSQATMEILAGDTGGQICTDNNDLSYCVKKAVNDSSAFYEIAYYPDAAEWHGEFHKIIVKTKESGLHLAYRQGYFARDDSGDISNPKIANAQLQQAACEDFLTATSLTLAVRILPAESPDKVKYWVLVDPDAISFPDAGENARGLNLMVAACTFDKSGKPLQLMQDPIERKLTDHEYKTLLAQHFVPHSLIISPGSAAAMVRVLVKDNSSGRIGSVNIPYPAPPAVASAGAAAAQPSSH
jgi:VWFA-related protein